MPYPVVDPYPVFLNQIGGGLNAGKVYIGAPDQDPETNPVAVFWDEDGTIPALQPLRTIGGYVARLGSPASVYTQAEYSIRVRDAFNQQVFYNPRVTGTIGQFLADLSSSTGASLIGFSQDSADAVLRTMLAKGREILSPADFGVTADGVDSSAAWQKLVNYVNASTYGAMVILPPGVINIGVTTTFTNHVTLFGRGSGVSQILMSANARLLFSGQRRHGGKSLNTQFSLLGLRVATPNVHTTSPVKVDYSAAYSGEGGLSPTLTMRDVLISGADETKGFTNGLELVDVPFPKLDNVVIRGDAGKAAQKLISYTGAHGSPTFSKVRGYYGQDAVYCSGEMEGYVFEDCEFVAVQRGISALDTTNGLQPRFVVRNTHINAEEFCIKTVGIDLIHIDQGNDLYGQSYLGSSATWTAVDVTPTLATGGAGTLVCAADIRPTVNADSAYAATKVGVRIRGASVSLEDYQIGGMYRGLTTAIQLDANTNGVVIDSDTVFRNCTTAVLDNGGNNIRMPKTKVGFTVSNTDANGRINVDFGGLVQFSSPPIVTPTVADGGATLTCNLVSTSTTGCVVQILQGGAVAGSGIAVRINWQAAGN